MRKVVKLNRRGLAHHMEMMISFVMFVLFVFFVILFVKPQDNSFLSGSVVTGAHHGLLLETQIDVVTFFVNVTLGGGASIEDGCIDLDIPNELIGEILNSSLSVGFLTDELKPTSLVTGTEMTTIAIQQGEESDSYYIYLSNEFIDENLVGCTRYEKGVDYSYTFGSFRRDKYISFKRFKAMMDEYETDYEGLRTRLGIPEVFEYAIIAPGVELDTEPPSGVDVVARDYIEDVIYEEGVVRPERITIKIWR